MLLALDVGTRVIGAALWCGDRWRDGVAIRPDQYRELRLTGDLTHQRVSHGIHLVEWWLAQHPDDDLTVSIERPPPPSGTKRNRRTKAVTFRHECGIGVMYADLVRHFKAKGIEAHGYFPMQARKAVIGRGTINKETATRWARAFTGSEDLPPDVGDAVVVGLAHIVRSTP